MLDMINILDYTVYILKEEQNNVRKEKEYKPRILDKKQHE